MATHFSSVVFWPGCLKCFYNSWFLSAGLFVVCRLGLARCSAAHRCGLWGVSTALPSSGWRGPHPILWLSTRIQRHWKTSAKWSTTEMQPEKETGDCEGGRAHPSQAGHLVRGSALRTVWDSPAGGNRQKLREEGWWLVWSLYSGTHPTVRAFAEALFCFCCFFCISKTWTISLHD